MGVQLLGILSGHDALWAPLGDDERTHIRIVVTEDVPTLANQVYRGSLVGEVVEALSRYAEFHPASKEVATESSCCTSGRVQRFQVNLESGGQEAVVYSSERHGVIVVESEFRGYYRDLGGESSWLGFPSAWG
jgi:hypothetical protein